MFNRSICIFLSVLLILGPLSVVRADSLWKDFSNRFTVTGSKYYGLQLLTVAGGEQAEQAFENDNYSYSARYRNATNLTVTGNLFTGLSFTGTFNSNRWNVNDQSMVLNYNRGNTQAAVGDITASVTGNDLMSFCKRLKGATVTHNFGIATVTAIASKSKAATNNKQIVGNNTPGPYYLGVTQIVNGSERVKIDENIISSSDYRMDLDAGTITFDDVVPSTSTISISFETQSFNNVAGSVYGVRTDIPIGKTAGFGMTYLTQQKGTSDTSVSHTVDQYFTGDNGLTSKYILNSVPRKDRPITVWVGPLLQERDRRQVKDPTFPVTFPLQDDYALSFEQGGCYIVFSRPIPSVPANSIKITYTPEQQSSVSSDRTVMGFDTRYKVSDALSLTGQFAHSLSDASGVGPGGSAATIRASGKSGKVNYSANLRNMGANYSPLESAGFFRSERGGGADVRYAFTDKLSYYSRFDRFSTPDITAVDQAGKALTRTTTQTSNGVEWKSASFPLVKLSRTKLDSSAGATDSNSQLVDALTASWDGQKYGAMAELSRSSNDRKSVSNAGVPLSTTNAVSTARLNFKYLPDEKLSLMADISGSRIKNSSNTNPTAKNYQLTANYIPSPTITLAASYRLSDSGGNYDKPYDPNSGSVVTPGTTTLASYGVKSATRMLSATWSPSSQFSFDTSLNYTSSEGENNTNTSVTGTDVGFFYNPFKILSIRANSSRQNGGFIGANGGLSSRLGLLSISAGPVKKFSMDIGYQKMLSSTFMPDSTTNGENSDSDFMTITANLRRELRGGRFVFTEYQTSTSKGFTSNTKSIFAVGMEYPLNQILGLKVDWRIIDYTDTQSTGNNYRANMLNAQIGARFK